MATTGLAQTQAKEMDLWRKWKVSRNNTDLDELLDSFQPAINKVVSQYAGVPLPSEAIEGEAIKQAVHAFETYNPKKGAALNTHVFNNLQKVYRYISSYQNIGKIPEARTIKIGHFQDIFAQLSNKYNRDPNTSELSDTLHWAPNEVVRMQKEIKKDLALEDMPFLSTPLEDQKLRDNIYFIYNSLPQEHKLIFEYSSGLYGKTRLSEEKIAQKMKMPQKDVRKIKLGIAEQLRQFI